MADPLKKAAGTGGGVLLNSAMEKELKRLGIKPADLLKIKSSGFGDRWKVKRKTKNKTRVA